MTPTRSSDLDLMRLREQQLLDFSSASSSATQRPTSFHSPMLTSVPIASDSGTQTAAMELLQYNPNLFTPEELHLGGKTVINPFNFGSAPHDFSEALDLIRSVWDRAKHVNASMNYEVTIKEEWTTAWDAAKSACDTKNFTHRSDIIKIARDGTKAAKDAAKDAFERSPWATTERAVKAAERAVKAAKRAAKKAEWTVKAAKRAESAAKRAAWTERDPERAAWAAWTEQDPERAAWTERDPERKWVVKTSKKAKRAAERAEWATENTWNAAEKAWNAAWNTRFVEEHQEKNTFPSKDFSQCLLETESADEPIPMDVDSVNQITFEEALDDFESTRNMWDYQHAQSDTSCFAFLEPSIDKHIPMDVDSANQNTFKEALDTFRLAWDRAKRKKNLFRLNSGKKEWTVAWNAAKNTHDTNKFNNIPEIDRIYEDAVNAANAAARDAWDAALCTVDNAAVQDAAWDAAHDAQNAVMEAREARDTVGLRREREAWAMNWVLELIEKIWNTTWNAIIAKKRCEESISHSGLGLIQTTKPQPALDTEPLQNLTKKRKHPTDKKPSQPLKRTRYNLRSREIIVQTRPSSPASLSSLDDELETHFAKADTPRVHGASAYYDLAAKDLEQNKMYDQLLICREKLVNLKIEMHGENHLLTAQAVSRNGDALKLLTKHDQALLLYEKANVIYSGLLGKYNKYRAKILTSSAYCYEQLNKLKDSLRFHEKSLKINKFIFGEESINAANGMGNVGTALSRLNLHATALVYLTRSIEITEKLLGPEHSDMIVLCSKLGVTLHCLGKYKSALKQKKRALDLAEKFLGEDHPVYSRCAENLKLTEREFNDLPAKA